ncbi:cysteine hydrolase family protein (plasmid) [Agrobacterium radiobacter]|uniref:Isochorismatase hydrolase n=1 Tax=Agrobacterium tumefaciens str. B6 TaxID=1183423 RepID=A0A822VA34_AGRTU|nr:isochorismatase family cysteine hydrolase [Agrobacterium tumefaciens]KWT81349.1 cysteine hydrolase [Agrobacterium tumefaciens str. B6]NTA05921.1 cysteine hydrolase [Agrobacterium tumefaciens]NTA94918.1 cysteine hydrolase [Agrobacterium tumefaciens]NTB13567.1 cysteine hydrolase [Agrobacterium tumefaciens]OCJ39475.1 cysteine hydrolase [Agrobacterium tumefaciens]
MIEFSSAGDWRHLCVDMQRIFAEDTPWHVEWMDRISEQVEAVVQGDPARCIFTCFIPPQTVADAPGAWRAYYEKWPMMTREALAPELVEVIPPLSRYIPPARIFRKSVYSPWQYGGLGDILRKEHVSTVVITGGETDVCVLATVLGAIDDGFHVILVEDALCSGRDATHDAALKLLSGRFSTQLQVCDTATLLAALPSQSAPRLMRP